MFESRHGQDARSENGPEHVDEKAASQVQGRVEERSPALSGANRTVAEEIAERERAEVSLRKSETRANAAKQQLLDAIESIPDGFILYDADERFVLCNQKYRDFYPQIDQMLMPGAKLEDVARTAFERGAIAADVTERKHAEARRTTGLCQDGGKRAR